MFFKTKEERFLESLPSSDSFSQVRETDSAGRGVYASRQINAGELLGIYPGRFVSESEFLEKEEFVGRSVKYSYGFKQLILDPTDIFGYLTDKPENRLALINEPPPGERVNIIPVNSKKYVWYLVVFEIAAGQQLLTTYGPTYQRSYQTDMEELQGKPRLAEESKKILQQVAKEYPWLRQGVKDILALHRFI